jgi:hypothetical protein
VGGAPANQHQARERDGIGADRPAGADAVETEFTAEARQSDVDDGDVENQHELRERKQGQRQPASRSGNGVVGRRRGLV